jgi:hypothetical protein
MAGIRGWRHATTLVAHRGGAVLPIAGWCILHVGVERGASWAATTPATVVKEGYVVLSGFPGRSYDVSSDGQRFLMVKSASDPTAPPPQIVVAQHFDEELKRLVPN